MLDEDQKEDMRGRRKATTIEGRRANENEKERRKKEGKSIER